MLNNSMSDEVLNQIKGDYFAQGVRYALDYLSSLYDGLEQTDLYGEFMTEEVAK